MCWKTKEILQTHKYNRSEYEIDLLGEFYGFYGKELWIIEVKSGKRFHKNRAKNQLRKIRGYLRKTNDDYAVIRTFYSHPKQDRNKKLHNLRLDEVLTQKNSSIAKNILELKYLSET